MLRIKTLTTVIVPVSTDFSPPEGFKLEPFPMKDYKGKGYPARIIALDGRAGDVLVAFISGECSADTESLDAAFAASMAEPPTEG